VCALGYTLVCWEEKLEAVLKLFASTFCVSIERRSCGARRDSGDRVFEIIARMNQRPTLDLGLVDWQ
jgi:hypothetical protein